MEQQWLEMGKAISAEMEALVKAVEHFQRQWEAQVKVNEQLQDRTRSLAWDIKELESRIKDCEEKIDWSK